MRAPTLYATLGLVFAASTAPAALADTGAPGLISRIVAADAIASSVLPATAKDGIPQTLQGIWWADFGDESYVMSFHPAHWRADTRTASLVLDDAGAMAYRSTEGPSPLITAITRDPAHRSLDFVLSEDGRSAKILATTIDAQGRSTSRDLQATMELEQDGLWRRHTGSQSYNLRRIVTARGEREAAFADYLKAFPLGVQVEYPTLPLQSDGKTVTTALQPGDSELYLSLPSVDSQVLTLSVTAAFPVKLAPLVVGVDPTASAPGRLKKIVLPSYYGGTYVAIHTAGAEGGTVSLQSAPVSIVTMSNDPSRLDVPLEADEFKVVKATPAVGHDGFYRLSAEDTEVLDQYGRKFPEVPGQAPGWITDDYAFFGTPSSQIILVHNTDAAPTTAHVNFTNIEWKFVDAGKLIVDGPAVTHTLTSPTDADRFDFDLPANVDQEHVRLYFDAGSFGKFEGDTINPATRSIADVFNPMNGSNLSLGNPVLLYMTAATHHLSVKFAGDINVANPDLTYTLRLMSEPKTAP